MSDDFDPYRKWLGIPLSDQPPDHYRLLGIQMFEDDPDVIENGADRQMAHVRRFQIGKQSALSQRLLNELSASRVCLLNAANKAEYDEHLQSVIDSKADDSEPAMTVEGIADWAADEPLHHRVLHTKQRRKRFPIVLSLFGVVLLLLVFAGYVTNWGRTESPPEKSPAGRTIRQRQLPPLPQPGDPLLQDTTSQDTTPDDNFSADEEPKKLATD